jgi:hypothetical protein
MRCSLIRRVDELFWYVLSIVINLKVINLLVTSQVLIVRKVTIITVPIRRWAFNLIHVNYNVSMVFIFLIVVLVISFVYMNLIHNKTLGVSILHIGTITICTLGEDRSIMVWDEDLIILRYLL